MTPLARITDEMFREVWSRTDIPLARMAEALGVTRTSLNYHANRLELPSRSGSGLEKANPGQFKRMWAGGVSCEEMARYFGYKNAKVVAAKRQSMGLTPRARGGSHSPIPLATFLESEIAERMRTKKMFALTEITEAVTNFYRLPPHALQGREKFRSVSRPRQMAYALCRDLTEASYPQIAAHFGGRDHTTVLDGVRRMAEMHSICPDHRAEYTRLTRACQASRNFKINFEYKGALK